MIRVADFRLHRAELQTRMPFKYGIATMTYLPHVFLHVTLEIDGRAQDGIAADHLPPKWFTKDLARDPRDEIDEMLLVIRCAISAARGLTAPTIFALWLHLEAQQSSWGAMAKLPPLLVHFGTSLVERAVLDAFARRQGAPLHRLLHSGALGHKLGAIHPELAGSQTSDWLSPTPLMQVFARHTVGLADPLTAADINPALWLADGLPQTLEDCIRRYGLRHFKIKICGQLETEIARLDCIAALLAKHAPADYACSIDGNECFRSVAEFRSFWNDAFGRPILTEFLRHLLFVEQPLHRAVALDGNAGSWDQAWPGHPPIIIDESDSELDSLPVALHLGYAGTSHKNCKGVFKGIANACRLAQLRRLHPSQRYIMSGEDLANIGPVALLQDFAVQALLGIASVERNGHHYFAGLSFWPVDWQAALLAQHADLYTVAAGGWPRLDVRDGTVQLHSVNAAPFGLRFLPSLAGFADVTT